MILKTGERRFSLPEQVEGHTTSLVVYNDDPEKNPQAIGYHIQRAYADDWARMTNEQSQLRGMPAYWFLYDDNENIAVWPRPDRDYVARFRYNPAVKEI